MSGQAVFRFYEELNDFLPSGKRRKEIEYPFKGTPSVKDAIESLGIPHPEVDLILVNGEPVTFSYLLKGSERVAVYPCFETLNISGITGLRDRGLRNTLFILDVHLGKLARYLRLFGFDTVYDKTYEDREIAARSICEKRILLTRDLGLLKHRDLTRGYWLRSQYPLTQLREVFARFDLYDQIIPFSRCLKCNGKIEPVERETVLSRVPERTREYFKSFYTCRRCGKVYWEGSHYERMRNLVDDIKKSVQTGGKRT